MGFKARRMTHPLSNLLAIVATIGLAVCLAVDLRRSFYRILSGRTMVLLSVFIWYLFEALRVPAQLSERNTQAEYDMGLFEVALSVAVFLVAYHFGHVQLFAPLARRLPMFEQPRVVWLLVLGGITIGIGSLMLYTGFDVMELFEGLTGMRRRWTGSLQRGRYGSWSTILYELQMFLAAVAPLAVALVFMKRAPVSQRCVAGLFVTWMFLRSFWSGTRGTLIPILLSLTAAIFWNAGPRLRRTLVVAGLPLVAVVGYFWSAAVVMSRHDGRLDLSAVEKTEYVGFEMFRELLFVSRVTRKGELPLEWGMTYFTQLVNPIPRALWPAKPVSDAGMILARAYGIVDKYGEPTMTNSPGFLGEAYLNFGFIGLLFVPAAAGVVVRAWDDVFPMATRSLPAFLIYAAGLATIFASGRSFNFGNYYGLLALFFLMVVIEKSGIATPLRPVYPPPPRPMRPAPHPAGRGPA